MWLSYGFDNPGAMLAKARRELNALEDALWIQDETAIGDALFDMGVALAGVRDGLRLHPSGSFQPSDVDACFDKCRALKVVKSGEERLSVLARARAAVAAWERFFVVHGLSREAPSTSRFSAR